MDRYSAELIGTETAPDSGGSDDWMISYLDVLTLIIALFVLLLAFSDQSLSKGGEGIAGEGLRPEHQGLLPDRSGLLPEETGVNPHYEALERSVQALKLQGVEAQMNPEGVTLRLDESLLFDSGRAQLTESGREVLQALDEVVLDFDGEISVEGHTDNVPINTQRFPSNWELSSARAISVVRFLQRQGVDPSRLRAVGYADSRPLANNDTAAGRAANRRVELLLRDLP